ncbi:hypothetical protein IMSAG049_00133 [Clostridiales bacterium]|nr:hypothetical protein IMSAG049_00133 [Clostridiales bacterium]
MGMEQYRKRMHHVGIVLPTMEAAEDVMDILGLEVDYKGYVKAYTADLIFTKYTENESPIEFIIPRGGVLAKYNNGKGGIAHICIEVTDIKKATDELIAKGYEMLEKEAVEGTEDIIVNFLRPKYSHGILIELAETVAPIKRD